ncbi:MAG: alpha/beta hydrolase [Pseudomonadota bacterium]
MNFISIDSNPLPSGAETFEYSSADNACLRAASFATENPRGTVVLMSGRSEFIEKYFEVICDLQARGFNVAMMDWRGQGLSERLLPERDKGHITDFGAYKADLRAFTEDVAVKKFAGPYVLMTHSMGGLPALQLLADGYDRFEAAILCAPMTRLFENKTQRTLIKTMAGVACRLGAARRGVIGVKEHSMDFDGNVLTSDPMRHARFRDLQATAPNAIIREPTYGWLHAAMEAIEDLHRDDKMAKLQTPIRIVSAENDKLVASSDHAVVAALSPLIDVVTVDGALHEILMERDTYRDGFWRAFDGFVDPILDARASTDRAAPRD